MASDLRKYPHTRPGGSNLSALRISAGLTQQQLADLVGVTSASISSWERGAKSPSKKYLPRLAAALRCPVADLMSHTAEKMQHGINYADLRIAAGLTRRQLAELVGVGVNTISYWERGICTPSKKNLPRLADALHFPLSEPTYTTTEKTRPKSASLLPESCKGPRSHIGASKLADLRLAAGLTQRQLAEAVGVKTLAIVNWERGQNSPPAKRRPALAEALHCSPDDLIDAINSRKRHKVTSKGICIICGAEYDIINNNLRKTCSPECSFMARSRAHRRKLPEK